jgi:hypothetical protein
LKGDFEIIEIDKLAAFKEELNTILDEVIASVLNNDLKKEICRYLRMIITAIENYQLGGIEPIMDAINVTAGNIVFNSEYRSFISDSELGGKIIKLISAVADSVAIVQGLPPIVTPILNLMSGQG